MVRFVFNLLILFVFNISAHAESHKPMEFLKQISGTKDEGIQIYRHFCGTCHSKTPQIPLGAPRIGVKSDWEPRLKQGLTPFLNHTFEGYNAMPARGGCFECTDEQLILALLAMLPNQLKIDLLKMLSDHKKSTK